MPWFGAGCCQASGCTMAEDQFNRADNLDIIYNWYEVPGYDGLRIKGYCPGATPTTAMGALTTVHDAAGATAIWMRPHRKRSATMVATVAPLDWGRSIGTDIAIALLMGVQFDPTTKQIGAMHVAQLVFADEPYIRLAVYGGGVPATDTTVLASDVIESMSGALDYERPLPCSPVLRSSFSAVLNERVFCAYCSALWSTVQANTRFDLYYPDHDLDPYYTGIAITPTVTPMDPDEVAAYIDHWVWQEAYDTNPICPFCACGCETEIMPGTLTVTLHTEPGDAGDCLASIDGSTAELTWDREMQNWTGEMITACVSWLITVTCPSMVPPFEMGEFNLQIQVHPTEPPGGSCYSSDPCAAETSQSRKASPSSSTCDPLNLRFGDGEDDGCWYAPWKVACSDLNCMPCCPGVTPPPPGICAEFWFEVTE